MRRRCYRSAASFLPATTVVLMKTGGLIQTKSKKAYQR
jgi:hypothetical protein